MKVNTVVKLLLVVIAKDMVVVNDTCTLYIASSRITIDVAYPHPIGV